MPTVRICAKCGEPTMEPFARKMEPYNSVYQYKCRKCDHEIGLVPVASLGVQITLGVLVGVIGWLIFFAESSFDIINFLIFLAVMALVPGMALYELWKHYANPVADKNSVPAHLEVQKTRNITKKPVVWIEKFGFLAGLAAPVVLIVAVLGPAAIIGFINFTYFDDNFFTLRFWLDMLP